jgi:hypothetical protein
MDTQVNDIMSKGDSERSVERSVQIRRQQQGERAKLLKEIEQSQKVIQTLNEERAPLAAENRKIEAEVGPIKYIAALIYGDNPDANLLEKAVRWVIILIVLVFDPLALVLILAADQTFEWHRPKRRDDWEQVWQPKSEGWPEWNEDKPKYEPDDGPLTDKQIETIKQASGVDQTSTKDKETNPLLNGANGISAEDWKDVEVQDTADTPPTTTINRELEAVKATAENLKKKFVNWTKKFKKKN